MNDLGSTPIRKVDVQQSSSVVVPESGLIMADRYTIQGIEERVRELKPEPGWPMDLAFVFVGAATTCVLAWMTWGPIRDALAPGRRAHYDLVGPILVGLTVASAVLAAAFFVVHRSFKERRIDTTTRIADDLQNVIQRSSGIGDERSPGG